MFRRQKLKFPPRTSRSLEDGLRKSQQDQAMAAIGEYRTISDWGNVFETRPFDIPFYTALNDRACILIYFSARSVPRAEIIGQTLGSRRPWILHTAAFLQGSYPLLRCNLVFPDNPQDPFFLESPLNLRGGDVQDFCHAILADEYIDVIINHEQLSKGLYTCAFHAPGLSSILRKELEQVLKNLKQTATEADFNASVRKMESVFPSGSAGIDRAKCTRLMLAGDAQNKIIEYSMTDKKKRPKKKSTKPLGKQQSTTKARHPQLEPYVQRLAELSRRTATSSGAGYLGAGEEQCRKIGEEIDAQWHFEGMVYVCDRIRDELGAAAARELEYAWDGIGSWRG